jgi:methionyl-tRNA formyltransferase
MAHGLRVAQPPRVRGGALDALVAEHAPDVLVIVAYGRLLPRAVIERPLHGAINAHFSLLPRHRGAAPVQWSLARGDTQTGVTTMRVVEALDAGPVLLQRQVAILPREHAPALEARLARVAAELLVETLAGVAAGTIAPREQDHAQATIARRLDRADGECELTMTARELEGRVRGFDPWPGAWVRCGPRRLRLVEAYATDRPSDEAPGTIAEMIAGEGLRVACGERTSLVVTTVQLEGRRAMSASDAVNGRVLAPGVVLSSGSG